MSNLDMTRELCILWFMRIEFLTVLKSEISSEKSKIWSCIVGAVLKLSQGPPRLPLSSLRYRYYQLQPNFLPLFLSTLVYSQLSLFLPPFFIGPMCTWVPIIGSPLSLSMSRFWNLAKTVNVVNVDTLVDDPSEDLSWRPKLMTLVDDPSWWP